MKKTLKLLLIIVILISFATGCKTKNNQTETKSQEVTITIYDKDKEIVYNKTVTTKKEILIDVLKEQKELEIETEDGPYGEYILSINNIKQGDNYYWTYYINNEYAPVGVSKYKIRSKETYEFKIEKYE